jgi:hypothetical protein
MTALILTAWVAISIGFAAGAWWATRTRDDETTADLGEQPVAYEARRL